MGQNLKFSHSSISYEKAAGEFWFLLQPGRIYRYSEKLLLNYAGFIIIKEKYILFTPPRFMLPAHHGIIKNVDNELLQRIVNI